MSCILERRGGLLPLLSSATCGKKVRGEGLRYSPVRPYTTRQRVSFAKMLLELLVTMTIISAQGERQLSVVVASAKEFRENAEECIGWARSARSDRERQIFLQVAQAWLDAAAHRERLHTIARAQSESRTPAAS